MGYCFGKLVKRPVPLLNDFSVIDGAGLLGEGFLVFADPKVYETVPGFCPYGFGPERRLGSVVEGTCSQILVFQGLDLDGIP
jgi:hypothetical protein